MPHTSKAACPSFTRLSGLFLWVCHRTAEQSDEFKLYILTTDDIAFKWFCDNPQENITVNSLANIMESYPVLRKLENERTRTEFNWTLSSFSIQFFIKKYNLPSITYLDADLCFYDDPKVLFDELKGESVIITPHNYTPCYDQTETSGRYCVQFMYFKNDETGNEVLEWWRNACEECCPGKYTDGKFGDQKYLDDWLSRFPGKVHEEKHLGCGIAPWNVQQFDVLGERGKLFIQNKITRQKSPIIFFHFHGLKEFICKDKSFVWVPNTEYEYSEDVINMMYKPYVQKLEQLVHSLPERDFSLYTDKTISFAGLIFRTIKRSLKFFIKSFLLWRTYKTVKEDYKTKEAKILIKVGS